MSRHTPPSLLPQLPRAAGAPGSSALRSLSVSPAPGLRARRLSARWKPPGMPPTTIALDTPGLHTNHLTS